MKKGILVFTVALLFAAFVPQPVAAAIDFGVKGGLSLGSYVWTGEDAIGGLKTPVFGFFFAFNINKTFAIQPEIYFLTQGGTDTYELDTTTYKYVDRWNYIHVPILAKVRLMPNGKLTPILFAGPALDYLLSAHYKYYVDDVEEYDKNIESYFKKTNISVVFGGGVEYKMDKLMLVLDIRYDLGLVNIDSYNDPTDALKTRALMFMVGVGF
jgi:hypothetical protein